MALIEAAVSGLPCIVTDAGGCREVVEICRNGVVVEIENPSALAEAIVVLIDNPEQFTNYSANAVENAGQFSIENAALLHVSTYENVLSLANKRARTPRG